MGYHPTPGRGTSARRRVLVGAALGACAVIAGFGAPALGAPALGAPIGMTATAREQATTTPIQHVVVLYQENHSFDNVLGDLCVVDQRCAGSISPVYLPGHGTVAPHVSPDVVPSVEHDVHAQVTAVDRGQMDGWAGVTGCQSPVYACMSYFTPNQIPALAALARQFVIADHAFQATSAPSWGAHLALASGGTLDGFVGNNPAPAPNEPAGPGWGCDSNRETGWYSPTKVYSIVPSCVPDYSLPRPHGGAFKATPVSTVPTIMDRLTAAHLSWKLYTAPSTSQGYVWAICPTFAECLYSGQANGMAPDANVITDAEAGSLPAFSVVSPDFSTSQHNGSSMAAGDNWIGQVVSAIENGPDWGSTAIFITYDDCGCFYDHVPPPRGKGIRAPFVIVSPYARPAFTDSTPANVVGSILAYVEHTFGLAPLTAVDRNAYAFSNAFNYGQTPLRPEVLPKPMPTSLVPLSELQDGSDPT